MVRRLHCNVVVLHVSTPIEDKCEYAKWRLLWETGECIRSINSRSNFKPGIFKLHETNSYDGVRKVNFDTTDILNGKNIRLSCLKIGKYTCTSADRRTHNRTDYAFVDRKRQLSINDIRRFRGGGCDTDVCLVVAELRVIQINKSHRISIRRDSIARNKRCRSSGTLSNRPNS